MTDARRYTGSLASSANMTASTSAEVNPFSERAISYDRNGNITALTLYGQEAASAEDVLAYTYSGDRISSITNSGTLGGGGLYSHDANGNVTHDGLAGLDLQYNLLNLKFKTVGSYAKKSVEGFSIIEVSRCLRQGPRGRLSLPASGSAS